MHHHCSILGFPCGSAGEESTCNSGDLGLIPGLGRSPGDGKGYPLQYSGLENSMDCRVHIIAKSWTQLSNFHFTVFHCYCFRFILSPQSESLPTEKSYILTKYTLAITSGKIPWRRERLPTPVFWPGEFHGLYRGVEGEGIGGERLKQ